MIDDRLGRIGKIGLGWTPTGRNPAHMMLRLFGYHAASKPIEPFLTPACGYPIRRIHFPGGLSYTTDMIDALSCRISDTGAPYDLEAYPPGGLHCA